MCSQSVVANWQIKKTAYLQAPLKLNQVSQPDALDFWGRRYIHGPRNSNWMLARNDHRVENPDSVRVDLDSQPRFQGSCAAVGMRFPDSILDSFWKVNSSWFVLFSFLRWMVIWSLALSSRSASTESSQTWETRIFAQDLVLEAEVWNLWCYYYRLEQCSSDSRN